VDQRPHQIESQNVSFCNVTIIVLTLRINWKGRPLTSYEVIVNLIAATRTKTGLKVYAVLDDSTYPLRKKVSEAEMQVLQITPHEFHGEWNYTIRPRHR